MKSLIPRDSLEQNGLHFEKKPWSEDKKDFWGTLFVLAVTAVALWLVCPIR